MMLFGEQQVPADFESNRNLRCQRLSAANVLGRNLSCVLPIENPKHSQWLPVGSLQRHGQQLPDFEFSKKLLVRAVQRGNVVGAQNLSLHHCLCQYAFWNFVTRIAMFAFDKTPADRQLALFQQPDK